MTRVHTHQVELAVAWPSAALSDAMLATAMIAGLRQLYPELSRQFSEARVVTHIILDGTGGPHVRPNGAIARDGIRVNPVTSDGHGAPSPLQWDRPPPSGNRSHPGIDTSGWYEVPVEATHPLGYRPDLVHPQPPGQDALGIPRTALTEAETLVNGLRVRVEELAVAVGWLLKQTASHTHIESTGRATVATPPPQVEHR